MRDMADAIVQAINAFGASSHDSRQAARRARIRRQYKAQGVTDWEPDLNSEKTLSKQLALRMQFASMAEYSDDEDEAGDGDDDIQHHTPDTNGVRNVKVCFWQGGGRVRNKPHA